MSKHQIQYAIIALNSSQVEEVIKELERERRNNLASWLRNNQNLIYGKFAKEWKPFKTSELQEIIEDAIVTTSNNKILKRGSDDYYRIENDGDYKCYLSKTHEIKKLDEQCSTLDEIANVKVFFIDHFSLFIDKYSNFATRADLNYSTCKNCCFLINYELPLEDQKYLEEKIEKTWPTLYRGHNNGFLHRISARMSDLNNFKNYILRTVEVKAGPYPDRKEEAKNILGHSGKENPTFKRGW